MRTAPAQFVELRRQPWIDVVTEITSWRGGQMLGTVEITGGTITDRDEDVPRGELSLSVPAEDPDQQPTGVDHPLGNVGQELVVRRGWRDAHGEVLVWFEMGRFPIQHTRGREVRAAGPMVLLEQARFAQPFTPGTTSLRTMIRRIVDGIVPVDFDPVLSDKTIRNTTLERDRLDELVKAVEAWPAIIGRAQDRLEIRPAWTETTPVETYSSGARGTLLTVSPLAQSTPPNAFTASTAPEDENTPTLHQTAYVVSGPLRWDGPYGRRPSFYASPMLTTETQLRDVAVSKLLAAQAWELQARITIVPDDRLEVGDPIRVVHSELGHDFVGRVLEIVHPLTPADGATEATVTVMSGTVAGKPAERLAGSVAAQVSPSMPVEPLPEPPVPVPITRVFHPAQSGTWRPGAGWTTPDVWQGGDRRGAVFYDDVDFTGLLSASLRLVRNSFGINNKFRVALWAESSMPSGSPTLLDSAIAELNGWKEPNTWTLPASWITQLVSGAAGGLGLHDPNQPVEQSTTTELGGWTLTADFDPNL